MGGTPPRPPADSPRCHAPTTTARVAPRIATTVYRPNKSKPTESQSGQAVAPPTQDGAAPVALGAPAAPARKKGSMPLVIVLLSFLVIGFLAVAGMMYLFRPH